MDLDKEIEFKTPKYFKFLKEDSRFVFPLILMVVFFLPGFLINLFGGKITTGYVIFQVIMSVVWGFGWTRLVTFRSEYKRWKERN